MKSTAEDIARRLEAAGIDMILDDRDQRPGVKFKDADLVGIPYRVTVGKKVTEGTVEVVLRSTREIRDVRITAVVEHLEGLLRRTGAEMAAVRCGADCSLWEPLKQSSAFSPSWPHLRWIPGCSAGVGQLCV